MGMKYHRILVPVDFSNAGAKALGYARDLARRDSATLVLVHVVYVPLFPSSDNATTGTRGAYYDEMRTSATEELERLAAKQEAAGFTCEIRVREGPPAREIVECARKENTDLVVIATHGRTGLKEVLLGSVAHGVIQRSPVPVVVVPAGDT